MNFSIITANWNGEDVLVDFFESLIKLQYKDFEVIFIDNGSIDNSLQIVNKYSKKLKIILIKNKKNLGFAPANNQGYKKSKGKYLLLLNNDTKVSSNLLNVVFEKMENDETIGALQPKIKLMDNPKYLDACGSFWTKIGFLDHWGFMKKDSKIFDKEKEVLSAKGACLFLRKDLIDKIELFDKTFNSYFEESDLCFRVWMSGKRVVYYPKTFIYHKLGFTIKRQNVLNINYFYYRNRIRSLIKNLGFKNLIITIPLHLFFSFGIIFAFIFFGKFKSANAIFRSIVWNFFNIKDTLQERKKIQNKRLILDKEYLPKLTKEINLKKFYNDFLRIKKDIDE